MRLEHKHLERGSLANWTEYHYVMFIKLVEIVQDLCPEKFKIVPDSVRDRFRDDERFHEGRQAGFFFAYFFYSVLRIF